MPFPKHANKQTKHHDKERVAKIEYYDNSSLSTTNEYYHKIKPQNKCIQTLMPKIVDKCQERSNVIFTEILNDQDIIECAVVKNNDYVHIFSSTKTVLTIKNSEGKIKIKSGHFSHRNDLVNKIVNGNITIFDTDSGTMYNGIIVVENNKLHFKFSNRPILPLYLSFNAILQFNIYVF